MARLVLFFALALSASSQTAQNPFDKAPPDVDDALRARVKEFYQDHVEAKYRKAEALVAEDSKDGFYAANKPALEGFKIGDVAYSERYGKAKVTIVGKMTVHFLGMSAPQVMDVPFPSYWKMESGQWFWYMYSDPDRMTPFGKVNANAKGSIAAAKDGQVLGRPDVTALQRAVKADRPAIKLARAAGSTERVTLTNTLPGSVQLSLDAETYPGLEVSLDRKELQAGEKAILTVQAASKPDYGTRVVRVLAQPINQTIDVIVSF